MAPASAIVPLVDHRGAARAVICVGAAVAPAHRPENAGTEMRPDRAMAKSVGDAAGAGAHLAPQAFGAVKADNASALGADAAGGDSWR